MAIDIQALVELHVRPALAIDTNLSADITTLIDSQIALMGWSSESMTDPESVWIVAITLEALLDRLALIYIDEVQEQRNGPADTRMPNRAAFFTMIQKAIAIYKDTAGKISGRITPDANTAIGEAWPGCGIQAWE